MITKTERLQKANELIRVISSCGREFFKHKNNISEFVFDFYQFNKGRLYYRDKWTLKLLPCWKNRDNRRYQSKIWCAFSDGGTLKDLIKDLASYIMTGEELPNHFGPWPEWYCSCDNYWGYPKEDMDKIRQFYKENF